MTVVADTANYGGRKYMQLVRVDTNDPKNPAIDLYFSGDVTVFAQITPQFVELRGAPGEKLSTSVVVTPVYPFRVKKVTASPGTYIKAKFKEVKTGGGRFYRITVTNTCKIPMQYFEEIEVRTDSKERPVLYIPVNAKLSKKAAEITPGRARPAKKQR